MAREPIVYIDRNKQKYKGRDAQVEALAPYPKRHNGDHWQLNRRPFVHGFYSGGAGCMTGKDYAPLCKIKEAAFEAGVPIEEIEQLTMADLIITPDLVSATVGGRSITTTLTAKPGRLKGLDVGEADYEILLTGGTLSLHVSRVNNLAVLGDQYQRAHEPGPIYLQSVTLGLGADDTVDWSAVIRIPEIGFNYLTGHEGASNGVDGSVSIPLGIAAINGATLMLEFYDELATAQDLRLSANLVYRHMRRK